MLARFVCPASRLLELEAALEPDGAPALSVVLDGGDWRNSPFRVEAVEMVGVSREDLADVETFCEVPLEEGWRDTLAAVAAAGAKAKLRCGGAKVPTEEQVAAFVVAARDAGVAWKATAGLHHPVRSEREHGFLNLLTGRRARGRRRRRGGGASGARRARPGRAARRGRRPRARFVSIGSCSFAEPVEDLQALGLL